jgi:hypothetical protein
MKKRNLAQRMREKAAAKGIIKPTKPPVKRVVKDPIVERMADIEALFEDASEVEQQEKQTKKRRTRKPRSSSSESKPKRTYTRRKNTDEDN